MDFVASPDPWLVRWLPLLTERAAGAPVLELGCGSGDDSATLAANGLEVVGTDLRQEALAAARLRVPSGVFLRHDLRSPFPFAPNSAGVIIASLCLHYFPWAETRAVVWRIHDTLRPNGLLLCRLNSTNDHHHGASGFAPIDHDYYLVNGNPKRFFDESSALRLFQSGWLTLSAEELITHKYERPKSVWEMIVTKVA